MPESLLVRDVMRIGVPTCKLEDPVAHVAAQMVDGGHTAVVVLDEEADTRGWINEHILAAAYARGAATAEDAARLAAPWTSWTSRCRSARRISRWPPRCG